MARSGHAVDANTVALWRFDESSGNALDAGSPGIYTLSMYGSAVRSAGYIGNYCLSLNGSTAYAGGAGVGDGVTTPIYSALISNSTVEFWVKPTGPFSGGSGVIFYYGGDSWGALYINYYSSNASMSVQQYSNSAWTPIYSPANVAPLNVWTHVAVRRRAGTLHTLELLINGKLVVSRSDVPVPAASTYRGIYVGRISYNAAYFGGLIDDMRVSNKVRTDDEIAAYLNTYDDALKCDLHDPLLEAQYAEGEPVALQAKAEVLQGDTVSHDDLGHVEGSPIALQVKTENTQGDTVSHDDLGYAEGEPVRLPAKTEEVAAETLRGVL